MQDQLKVLLVDDDAALRLATKQMLHSRRPEALIREAASRPEALEALRAGAYDCVLLGDVCGDGSGQVWLAVVCTAARAAPVIVLAAPDDDEAAAEAVRAGATDCLSKADLTPPLLDHCLRSAIRYQRCQEQARRGVEALHLRDRAIDAASNGIVISDPHRPDCPIIYANPAFSAITGYPHEEVIGRNGRFLQGEDTDAKSIQKLQDCLRHGSDCRITLRNYRKDGSPFWNELTISPVHDPSGKLTYFVGVQTDVTERRHAEDALRQIVAHQHALLRDMLTSVTQGKLTLCASEEDLPTPLTRFGDPIVLSATGGIRELRRHVSVACHEAGLPDMRRDDLESAVGEAAMNAVVHAEVGTGHVFTHERGTVQVRVEDEGKGIAVADLPNATLRKGYSTAGTMGHGFKMILMTVDRVHLLTGSAGTCVVIEQDRAAAPPSW